MRDIFVTLVEGADALQSLGLNHASQGMLMTAEDALVTFEEWLYSKYQYLLEEAEAAIVARNRIEGGSVTPRRAHRDDSVTYLEDYTKGDNVRNIDEVRAKRGY